MQKIPLRKGAVLVTSMITDIIMNPMIRAMIRANMTDEEILDAIAESKTLLQFLKLRAPNEMSENMCSKSIWILDDHSQTWLDETRLEIEQEKMHVLETS